MTVAQKKFKEVKFLISLIIPFILHFAKLSGNGKNHENPAFAFFPEFQWFKICSSLTKSYLTCSDLAWSDGNWRKTWFGIQCNSSSAVNGLFVWHSNPPSWASWFLFACQIQPEPDAIRFPPSTNKKMTQLVGENNM